MRDADAVDWSSEPWYKGSRWRLPKIYQSEELPDWITSSSTAAYSPFYNAIFLKKDRGLRDLPHELGHWFGCCFGRWGGWIHKLLDRRAANKNKQGTPC